MVWSSAIPWSWPWPWPCKVIFLAKRGPCQKLRLAMTILMHSLKLKSELTTPCSWWFEVFDFGPSQKWCFGIAVASTTPQAPFLFKDPQKVIYDHGHGQGPHPNRCVSIGWSFFLRRDVLIPSSKQFREGSKFRLFMAMARKFERTLQKQFMWKLERNFKVF